MTLPKAKLQGYAVKNYNFGKLILSRFCDFGRRGPFELHAPLDDKL